MGCSRREVSETGRPFTFYYCGMSAGLPLPALLAHALVAFIIEFDNEFEHRMPHRTTLRGQATGVRTGPWLVSMAMWYTCMRFVGDEGIRAGELENLARTGTNLNGMQRWGYIVVEPDPANNGVKRIHATDNGRKAREIWQTLFNVIEKRWQERFGEDNIAQLRESLLTIARRIDIDLPDCLPILGHGLFSRRQDSKPATPAGQDVSSDLLLPALLSKVLLAFAIEFERDADVSLAISANVLRLAGDEGVPLRDLPRMSGASKEGIAMALSFLERRGYAAVRAGSSGSRVRVLYLTPKGQRARQDYSGRIASIEESWRMRLGKKTIATLRKSLEQLNGPPLWRGLEPYPDGWRASVPRLEVLPHYPMILHRGGFPDGS